MDDGDRHDPIAHDPTVAPKDATLPGGHGAPPVAAPALGSGIDANAATVMSGVDAHGETVAPDATEVAANGATLAGAGVVTDMTVLPSVDAASYAIGPEIARGGMGKILGARDRRLRRDVVIKVTRQQGARVDPRFEREALITARLQHPSIVRVYEAGILTDGRAFYAMERVRGRSLDTVLDGTSTLEERLALLPHAIAVADAIAYAHSEGVLHRDLKPSNVLVGPFGETVVIDWGLAKDLRSAELPLRPDTDPAQLSGDSSLTQVGSVLGTPSYMAPEQARGEAADERTDIYALGALLYTLLAGTPAYRGDTTDDVIAKVAAGDRVHISEREPRVPPELATIVERAMALSPQDRYRNAKLLADELRQFAAGKLVASHQYGLWRLLRRWLWRHRITAGVAGFAVVVLALVVLLSFKRLSAEMAEAQEARDEAQVSEVRALRAKDDMVIDLARSMLAIDPSKAAAWLRKASNGALAEPRSYEIAEQAAQLGLARALIGHTDDVEHVIAAPDGGHVATGSDDSTVRYWDLATGAFVEMRGHTGPIETMAMSHDGAHLATAGTDHDVWLWDLAAGTGRKLHGHGNTVRGVAFSPDGARLASTSEDGALFVWDVATGTGKEIRHHHHGLRPVIWTLDGKGLIVGGYDGAIGRIDPDTGAGDLPLLHHAEVRTLALSPDGTYLAAGDEDGVATLWTADLSAKVRDLDGHVDVVRVVTWSPDSKHLISGGGDEFVRVYAVPAGKGVKLVGHSAGVKDVNVSADGKWIASAGIDGNVFVWPMSGGAGKRFRGHGSAVKAVSWTRDDLLISGSEDDVARIWRLDSDTPPHDGPELRTWLAAHSNVEIR